MPNEANLELLKKCDTEVKNSITAIKNVLDAMKDPDFKLMVIESKDQLKAQETVIKAKLTQLKDKAKEENKMAEALSKVVANTKLLLEKTDQHIANLLFDTCHEGLKELYKGANTYHQAGSDIKDLVIEIIQILIDLRENLVAYL